MKAYLLTFVVLAVHIVFALGSPPRDARVFSTVVRKQGDEGVHSYRIPGLATTPAGTLIAVFDARNKSGRNLPGDIDVAIMRSTDNGRTWGPMQRILDFDAREPGTLGNGVGDPCVLVDAQAKTIFVAALWSKGNRAWSGSGPGLEPAETGQLVLTKSTDDGHTWSKPMSITPQVKRPEWRLLFQGPGAGIQLRNGTLVLPAQFKDALGPHSCFVFSRDRGLSWRISPPAISGSPPTSESQVAELADGSLLLSMRNESKKGLRAWAQWTWSGKAGLGAWSEPWFAVTDPTCMASLIRHPHGELLFSNPNNPKKRVNLTIRASTDNGRTWSGGRLLDARMCSYSCMTVLKDGRIGVLYEAEGAGNVETLTFASFPLEWVLEGDVDNRAPQNSDSTRPQPSGLVIAPVFGDHMVLRRDIPLQDAWQPYSEANLAVASRFHSRATYGRVSSICRGCNGIAGRRWQAGRL